MVRRWSFRGKLQEVHKYHLDCFHGNGIIASVAVSHFPQLLGQSETSKNRKIITPVLKKKENRL